MARRETRAVTWGASASLSSWTWFGADAPNGLVLPAGMDGAQIAFVGTESGADGNANPEAAQDLLDVTGTKVTLALPAAGGRIVYQPDALRAQGWIALRSETGVGAAQNQAAPRAATWLWPVD
jgi:hypothetical protein